MKKLLLSTLFAVSLLFYFLPVSTAYSADGWVEPQPPFSKEGNPPEGFYYGAMFDLFKYLRPAALEIYENRDITRNYENLEVCGGSGGRDNPHDFRDYECTYDDQTCDGGDVQLCKRGTLNIVRSGNSRPNSSCTAKPPNENHPYGTNGTCRYTKIPNIKSEVKGTDFSNADETVFDKIQSKSGAYNNIGTDNAITWGSRHLSSTFEQKILNQVLVVRRAKQTKATLNETGSWPLGWVDWGYKTPNGKTLLQINDELPNEISDASVGLVEGVDDFFLNAGNPSAISDFSGEQKAIMSAVNKALGENPQPTWLIDLMQAPMYSPSWRQSYVRPSICVWDICCPGYRCIVPPPTGIKRALYYDNNISQAFGASLDAMLTAYSLDEGTALFNQLAIKNPLIRFTTSASVNATPPNIMIRLDKEIGSSDPCFKYRDGFSWLWFGTFMDYVLPGDFFDTEKKCPVYAIAPELVKQNAAAFYQSPISALIAMIWGRVSPPQDDVDSVYRHLLTIPEAMSQSIQEIQQTVYDTGDTLAELEAVKDFNISLSNTVDDGTSEYLYTGQTPYTSRRYLGLYPCDDDMYSSQLDTGIKEYALGTRIGCFDDKTTATSGKCDGTKFAKIIADSPWKEPTTAATQVVLNSAMFVGGKLNPELEKVYAEIEQKTGVPCEVLAGHHFEEASSHFTDASDPEKYSAANGGPVGEQGGFKATVESAAKSVMRNSITNTPLLIKSMSYFNGGGNANCQSGFTGGNIPYTGCPRQFIGEDDPYVTNMIDTKHNSMYLLYCGDFLPCTPPKAYGTDRPGAFAVALAVYNNATSKNSPVTSPNPSNGPIASTIPGPISTGSSLNPAGDCGDGYIDTALGCLPYERTEFIMSLLRFLVGIAGAIALVVMLVATVMIMTAAGDTKKTQSGRDLFFSAVTGLLFLVFAVSLLRIFGADILRLPGF